MIKLLHKLKCMLGWHEWEEKYEILKLIKRKLNIFKGFKCKHCGKIKDNAND